MAKPEAPRALYDLPPDLRARVEASVRAAHEQLDQPTVDLVPGFDVALDAVQVALRGGLMRLRDGTARDGDGLGTVLTSLREVQEDIRTARFELRAAAYASVEAAITALESVTDTRQFVVDACAKLGMVGRFDRVVLSCVDGTKWVPMHAHFAHDRDRAHRFLDGLEPRVTRLEGPLREADLVRRQLPMLVIDAPADEPERQASLVRALGSTSYVAAPIRSAGRVVGLFHADRAPSGALVDALDRDVVWAFAEAFGPVADRVLLRRHLRTRRAAVSTGLAQASLVLDDLANAEVRLPARWPAAAGRPGRSATGSELTRREREVLSLMAKGASNRTIGSNLYLAVGTVKGHVRNILRKLGVVNRAEAVSWYLRHHLAEGAAAAGGGVSGEGPAHPSGGYEQAFRAMDSLSATPVGSALDWEGPPERASSAEVVGHEDTRGIRERTVLAS